MAILSDMEPVTTNKLWTTLAIRVRCCRVLHVDSIKAIERLSLNYKRLSTYFIIMRSNCFGSANSDFKDEKSNSDPS